MVKPSVPRPGIAPWTTELHLAVADSDVKAGAASVRALLARGADPNEADDKYGCIALHRAAEHMDPNATEVVQLLLDAGANIDARDKDGATPLFYAILGCYGSTTRVKLLLARGADPVARDNNGVTPRELCNQVYRRGGSELTIAAILEAHPSVGAPPETPQAAELRDILRRTMTRGHPFDPHASRMQDSLGILETVRAVELVRRGALGDTPSTFRVDLHPALRVACEAKAWEVVRAMVAAGASLEEDESVMFYAAEAGEVTTIDFMLARGASADGLEGGFYNPLVAAAKGGHLAAVQRLLAAGANPEQIHLSSKGPHEREIMTAIRDAAVPRRKYSSTLLIRNAKAPFPPKARGAVQYFDVGTQTNATIAIRASYAEVMEACVPFAERIDHGCLKKPALSEPHAAFVWKFKDLDWVFFSYYEKSVSRALAHAAHLMGALRRPLLYAFKTEAQLGNLRSFADAGESNPVRLSHRLDVDAWAKREGTLLVSTRVYSDTFADRLVVEGVQSARFEHLSRIVFKTDAAEHEASCETPPEADEHMARIFAKVRELKGEFERTTYSLSKADMRFGIDMGYVIADEAQFPYIDPKPYKAAERLLTRAGFSRLGDLAHPIFNERAPEQATFLRCFASKDGRILARFFVMPRPSPVILSGYPSIEMVSRTKTGFVITTTLWRAYNAVEGVTVVPWEGSSDAVKGMLEQHTRSVGDYVHGETVDDIQGALRWSNGHTRRTRDRAVR